MNMIWRPQTRVRTIAIGVFQRGNQMLATSVHDDAGAIKGWRPPGGEIEFGERAVEALRREIQEELGQAIEEPRLMGIMENIYEHHDARGHEIVFAFEAVFADRNAYRSDKFEYVDGEVACTARWVDLTDFRRGLKVLYPVGLLDHL
jgi:ADP-ribose pyrophosphatase YjhB (NUDIX family)